jgi:hypothetical protein
MSAKKFRAEVLAGHKGAAVEVPFDPAVQWRLPAAPLRKGRRGHQVQGSVNGVRFEGEIVPRSKKFYLVLDEELLVRAEVPVGELVTVVVQPRAAHAQE